MDRDSVEPEVGDVPGPRAREWIAYHRGFAAKSTYEHDFVWSVLDDAVGPFCRDADGNTFLDFTSHVGSAPLGYNNPGVREKLREFEVPEPSKIAGQDLYASTGWPPSDPEFPGPPQLMERLVDSLDHYGLDTVFLSNSGAEAVENAIKICYDHSEGAYGVTFQGAFHGRTLGALSLNRSKSVHRKHYPEVPGVHSFPYCSDSACSPDTCGCGFFTDAGSGLRNAFEGEGGYLDPSETAYVIIEPVQGEGGYRVPSGEFMREVQEVCSEHDVLVVADEIQSGVGRTGEMWASDHYALEPDVVASAKALRVGATVSRRDVFPSERARISSTWGGGDLVAALQGCVTVDVIEEEGLLGNAEERGQQFRELVRDDDPDGVVDVRGLGLMLGVEVESREVRDAVMEEAYRRGLLTLGCGVKTVRLMPPLDVREREIRLGASILTDSVNAV